MPRILSNHPTRKDFVERVLDRMRHNSSSLNLAAPFFTYPRPALESAAAGKQVNLLVRLSMATSPDALGVVLGKPNISVRIFSSKAFHAKIYVFDHAALLGSSNLTAAGLQANREAVICLDQSDDRESIEEIRSLFQELWDEAGVLTPDQLSRFADAVRTNKTDAPDPDRAIQQAVGFISPSTINVASSKRSKSRLFEDQLKRQVYEKWGKAFSEVQMLLDEAGLLRPEIAEHGPSHQANRFLNWVRLVKGSNGAWETSPLVASPAERKAIILALGAEWVATLDHRIPEEYSDWLKRLSSRFGVPEVLGKLAKDDITDGLLAIHAFEAQNRFVTGGVKELPATFWRENGDDVTRVRNTLLNLLHGPDHFIERLYDTIHDRDRQLARFKIFCAMELMGSLRPELCPPLNSRIAKGLRRIGYDVPGR